MLTKEKEGGRVKCHKYWPDSGAKTFSHLQVILHATNEYPDYVLREFKIIDTRVFTVNVYHTMSCTCNMHCFYVQYIILIP